MEDCSLITSLDRFSFLSAEATDKPYLSFPVAVEAGVLIDPESKAKPLGDPAGVTLLNGYMPNVHEAGLVELGEDIIAFDLTALDIIGDHVRFSPAPKSSVENDGQITQEGVIVVQNQQGMLRIAAFAIDGFKRPWLADRLRLPRSHRRSDERISVFGACVLEMPDLEVTEIDLTTNSVIAKPRTRFF